MLKKQKKIKLRLYLKNKLKKLWIKINEKISEWYTSYT